jgi:hypothetical protein
MRYLMGQCHEIFDFWLFLYSQLTTSLIDTGGKWKKPSIIKVLIILFGHL